MYKGGARCREVGLEGLRWESAGWLWGTGRHLGDEGRPPALQQATQRTRTSSHGAWAPSGGLRTASTGGLGAGG